MWVSDNQGSVVSQYSVTKVMLYAHHRYQEPPMCFVNGFGFNSVM